MEIQLENEVVDVSRLYTVKSYSDAFGIPHSTLNYKVLTNKVNLVWIGGVRFILAEKGLEPIKKGVE